MGAAGNNARKGESRRRTARSRHAGVAKAPTGIAGFDEITGGGLPRGRPTLVCGGPGCGKTLFATEFLVRGAIDHGEPGVLMTFEETAEDLAANVASLGFRLDDMIARRKLFIDHVRVERSEIEETGEYDLEGLFIRLGHAIDTVKAKRVVLDTIETLFAGFTNEGLLRAELRRLFGWLRKRGVTTVVTGERGEGALTRQGLEEYVSDCVVLLDHRVVEQQSTRRLRIVKYRGSAHGTNEYPFLIDEQGFSVLPITSLGLQHTVSNQVVSTGVASLDAMLGPKGVYRGSSVLISGTAGSGKTTLASCFADATCRRGERCLLFSYEESQAQIVRNMGSIGLDLQRWIDKGLLQVHAARPSTFGLEMHLVEVHKLVQQLRPHAVVIDPITNLVAVGSQVEAKAMLVRLIDFLKSRGITAVYVDLTGPTGSLEQTDVGVSSLIDTWLLVRQAELNGERNRSLYLLKSRGMSHSNQVREFLLSDEGVELRAPYLGPEGVLTGSARLTQEWRDRDAEAARRGEIARQESVLEARRKSIEAQMAALDAELKSVSAEVGRIAEREQQRRRQSADDRQAMATSRGTRSNGEGR